jgi:uncharacterized protein (DUF1330 family)
MVAYVIVRSAVADAERYRKYAEAATAATAKFGGRYLARGGETLALEGPPEGRRVVILEFPSLETAKAWYHSPEYQAAKALRQGAAEAEFLAVQGL